jgi:hypothetical protein
MKRRRTGNRRGRWSDIFDFAFERAYYDNLYNVLDEWLVNLVYKDRDIREKLEKNAEDLFREILKAIERRKKEKRRS